ncbi:MAG: carbohydrate ABC transporter permease, partial [Firmicutes bacterium]|nr:carbohydrate ABC transporter permease [Bacillota bacterium]
YVLMTVVGILFLFPFFWMVITSFKSMREVIALPPIFIPSSLGIDSYARVFKEIRFARFFLNSLIVAVAVTAAVLLTSSMSGFAFAKYSFIGKAPLFIGVLSTMMVPFEVVMIPLYLMMVKFNWANSYWGLIVPSVVSPFGIFLMRQFIESIPDDMIDAARIDGCSEFRLYWQIVMPNVKPALSALTIFTFMWQWNAFLWPFIIISSDRMRTLPLALAFYQNMFTGPQYNVLMAATVLTIAPTVLVFLALQKHFVRGIALTGMKA